MIKKNQTSDLTIFYIARYIEMLKNYKVGKKAEMMKKIKRYQKLFDLFKKDLKYKNNKNTFDKSKMGLLE